MNEAEDSAAKKQELPLSSVRDPEKITCGVCPHACRLAEGQTGRCRARGVRDGKLVSLNYGVITSLALDPVEKKPLRRFYPGSRILSAGSFGCSLSCPFCQNWEISMSGGQGFDEYLPPEELAAMAERLRPRGNIGVAFTYNEPLVGCEYVIDTAKLLRERGLKTVLVTNGMAAEETAGRVLPLTDALNIDLKSFRREVYRDMLGGDLDTVRSFITDAVRQCHVELTSLIVPGMNDTEEEMREMTEWIAGLPGGDEIPLHVTRYFPRYRMQDRPPTERGLVLRLAGIAREKLRYVYPGNL